MFENLQEKLQRAFKTLRGQATLTEENMDEALKEIRLALLEADVNFKAVRGEDVAGAAVDPGRRTGDGEGLAAEASRFGGRRTLGRGWLGKEGGGGDEKAGTD